MNMAAGAATLMVLARVLPDKVEYGAVCQLIVLYMVLSQLFAVGLPQSNYFFLPRYRRWAAPGILDADHTVADVLRGAAGVGLFLWRGAAGQTDAQSRAAALLRIFAIYPLFMMPTLAVESTLLHADRAMTTVDVQCDCAYWDVHRPGVPTLLHMTLPHTIVIWMGVAAVMCIAALILIFSSVRGLPFCWHPGLLRDELTISLPLALEHDRSTRHRVPGSFSGLTFFRTGGIRHLYQCVSGSAHGQHGHQCRRRGADFRVMQAETHSR